MGEVFSVNALSCHEPEEDSSWQFSKSLYSSYQFGSLKITNLNSEEGVGSTGLPFEWRDNPISDDSTYCHEKQADEAIGIRGPSSIFDDSEVEIVDFSEFTEKCDPEFLETNIVVTKRYIMTRISGMPSVASYAIDVVLKSPREQKSKLFTDAIFGILVACTPKHLHPLTWKKIFDLEQDGRSFKALKRRIDSMKAKYTMLILKTSEDTIIGAFSSARFKFDGKIRGNDACFLFSLDDKDICVYDASHTDHNCWCMDKTSIRFGIANRKSSLFIAKDFAYGTSGTSPTFGLHAPLTRFHRFEILRVEVWSPVPGE